MFRMVFALIALCAAAAAQVAPVGRQVTYKQADGHALSLYIDTPPAGHSAHTVIVFFHGGAWTMGEVSQFNQQSAYLARRGMVAVQVEYRLLSRDSSDPPRVCAEDARSAMRWVRAHAAELSIDPQRIAAGGGSAGGYLAAFTTMNEGWDSPGDDLAVSPRANALVLFNPVLDGGPKGFGYKRFGESYRQYSPFYHISAAMPPTLIQSGDADKLVSPESLRDFQAAAQKAGVRCELVFYPGQPHSFFTPEPYTTQSLAVAAKFLDSLGFLLPGPPPVQASSPVSAGTSSRAIVAIDTRTTLPVPPRTHFAGANMQLFLTGSTYRDVELQRAVAGLAPGWLRFPGGTIDDVYDWTDGSLRQDWIGRFKGTRGVAYGEMSRDAQILRGKGPVTLADYATFVASQPQHPSTIGVVNTFTDTPESAGRLATDAARRGLQVDVWELGNEPFFFPSFYPDATAYLRAAEPYAAAIRKAVPGAKVAVYLQRNDAWIDALAAYPNRYWDELYWHPYPGPGQADRMPFYNNFLLNLSNRYIDGALAAKFGSAYKLELSEYNINALRGGLYGAVFVAEYTMRLSADTHVTHAGMHILTGTAETLDAAILPTNDHVAEAIAAGEAGKTVDLSQADFGYYLAPYGLALTLIDPVINSSTALWPTEVRGGTSVAANDGVHPAEQMPAVYAQAYRLPGDRAALLLTNKSGSSQTVTLLRDGKPLPGVVETTSFGGSDPEERNNASRRSRVSLQNAPAQGEVTVPPYGIMAVRWTQR